MEIREIHSKEVSEELLQQMMNLACQVSSISRQYLIDRLTMYKTVWIAKEASDLIAFQFIYSFEHHQVSYFYFGPLFSKQRGFLPLFLRIYASILAENWRKPYYMMTEVQNPKVFLVFKTLFWNTSYPKVHDFALSKQAIEAVSIYEQKLEHVTSFDPICFKTKSSTTLYRPVKGDDPVNDWLKRRGVRLEQGDSQILLVAGTGKTIPTLDHLWELLTGLVKLRYWFYFRKKMILRFEEVPSSERDLLRSDS